MDWDKSKKEKDDIFTALRDRFRGRSTAPGGESKPNQADEAQNTTPQTPDEEEAEQSIALAALWALWSGQPAEEWKMESLGPEAPAERFPAEWLKRERGRQLQRLEARAAARLKQMETAEGPLAAECAVCVSQDEMAAWVVLLPPIGQAAEMPGADVIRMELERARVTYGIDEEKLQAVAQGDQWFKGLLIAQGTPPVEGKDGSVEDYFSREPVRYLEEDKSGKVDFRAQKSIQNVFKGAVICEILPPEPGTDGRAVTGRILYAKPVKPAAVPRGSNTAISEDGRQLVAALDGHVVFSSGAFLVKPQLEIESDVDYKTGNIDFFGDVRIRGTVKENFSVRATGAVRIEGAVEAATVEAGGEIVIVNGILGDNKAIIKSRKSVHAKYMEYCVVYAGDSVYADCILASQVFCDNMVSAKTGRGVIIGGCLTAGRMVEAVTIGSMSHRRTDIFLGMLPAVKEELSTNQDALDSLYRDREGLMGKQDSDSRLRLTRVKLKIQRLELRQKELEAMQPDLSLCRFVCGTAYPNTQITIGGVSRQIDTVWKDCKAIYNREKQELQFI